jgi:hypothetical protein
MLLPESVYNRIPQIWILMGLMFFACGLYLGFEYKMVFAYLGMGAVSVLRGIWIYNARSEVQKQRHQDNLQEARDARDCAAAENQSAAPSDSVSAEGQTSVAQETPSASESATVADATEPLPDTSEAAANDSVVVTEPRAREPGEPVQYDPYDSLATRQHK